MHGSIVRYGRRRAFARLLRREALANINAAIVSFKSLLFALEPLFMIFNYCYVNVHGEAEVRG
jgi:hypothetical protein